MIRLLSSIIVINLLVTTAAPARSAEPLNLLFLGDNG
jgi:hypothetical protein